MLRLFTRWSAFLLLLCPGLVRAADGWARLKLGMDPEEARAAIGAPLFRTAGRGFELWIYDNHAEILFFGTVIGWTSPGSGAVAGAPHDIWRSNPQAVTYPTFLTALPPPPPPKDFRLPQNLTPYQPDRFPSYRFHR